jgi:hypothetical protein
MQFTVERQLTVALENEPGRLAEISRIVAGAGVNIQALCVVDNIEQGVVRLLVDDPSRCREALAGQGCCVVEAEVLAIRLSDRRGKLATVTKALADARVNIDYAYATIDPGEPHGRLVVKASNTRLAEEILGRMAGELGGPEGG